MWEWGKKKGVQGREEKTKSGSLKKNDFDPRGKGKGGIRHTRVN